MISISSELSNKILNDEVSFEAQVQLTLDDGNILTFDKTNILQNGGFKYETATTASGGLSIGAAVTSKITIVLYDSEGLYKMLDFVGAIAQVEIKATYSGGSYTMQLGYFLIADDPIVNEKTVTLTLYDFMCMLDKPYDPARVSYPTTVGSLLRSACSACGMSLYSEAISDFGCSSVSNTRLAEDIAINDPGLDSGATWHDIVVYCCQILNCVAVMRRGSLASLALRAYSLSSPLLTVPASYTKSLNKATIDTTITGLNVTGRVINTSGDEEDYKATRGGTGYILDVSGNPLLNVKESVNDSISTMWTDNPGAWQGFTFRKVEAELLELPFLEAGDTLKITDADGVTYTTFATHVTYTLGEGTKIVNDSESPSRHKLKYYTDAQKTKAIVERWMAKEKSEREVAIEQLQAALDTSIDGLNGFFFTEETQSGGGKIYYYHNHPKKEDSDVIWKMTANAWGVSTDGGKTYTTGVTADGLAVTRMLSTIGLSASWINTGELTVKDSQGRITFYVNADTGAFNINSISGQFKTSMTGGRIDFYYSNALKGMVNADGLYFGSNANYGHIGHAGSYIKVQDNSGVALEPVSVTNGLILTTGPSGTGIFLESGKSYICMPKNAATIASTDIKFDGVIWFIDRYYFQYSDRPHITNWNIHNGIFQGLSDRKSSEGRGSAYIDASSNPTAYNEGIAICAGATRFYDASESSVIFNVTTVAIHAYETLNMHGNSITNQSDIRLKDNVSEYKGDVLKTLYKLELANFDWRETQKHVSCGFIAQQFKEILPELVHEDENGILSIAEVELIPYLVAAIQAIFRRIAPIEAAAIEVKKKWKLDDFGLTTFDALEAVRLERWARGIQGLMENDNSTTQEADSNENEDV